jgi:hypothetical protein
MLPAQSRLFVWLVLGELLHVFVFGIWTIPAVIWFVPLFLLRLTRNAPDAVRLVVCVAGFVWGRRAGVTASAQRKCE